jgi:hypothetical protein
MFLELAKQSDVVIENLSPGSMERLGLGYADIARINPGIVYCSIAGYGQTGPYKDLPAHSPLFGPFRKAPPREEPRSTHLRTLIATAKRRSNCKVWERRYIPRDPPWTDVLPRADITEALAEVSDVP